MGRGRTGKRTKAMVRIARERILILHRLAEERALRHDLELADRYAGLARRIGMRYNVRVPSHLKRRICKGCGSYLMPGGSCTVRTRAGRLVYTCKKCGRSARYPMRARRPKDRRKKGPGPGP